MAMATETDPEYVLSIDIEKGGDSPVFHPILAIGVCFGSRARSPGRGVSWVVKKQTWCLDPFPGQTMEDRCVREFWSENAPLLERIKKSAAGQDPILQLKSFSDWLSSLSTTLAGARIVILSDNPSYDIGHLDHALCSRGLRALPLRLLGDGRYRSIGDPTEMIEGQGSRDLIQARVNERVAHDHWPENDAEHIFWQYVYACQVRDQLAAGKRLSEITLTD